MAKRGAQVGDEYAASESGYDGDNETLSSDSSDDGNQEPMWKRGDVGDDLRVSEMEGVMLYRGDAGITEDLENPSTPSYFRMAPNEISITALLKGAVHFVLAFSKALPYDLIVAYAHFGDMHVVELKRENRYNLTGYVPATLAAGKVKVRVTSQAGDYLGETWFECLDEMPDMFERLKGDPDLQRSFFNLWTQHNGFLQA